MLQGATWQLAVPKLDRDVATATARPHLVTTRTARVQSARANRPQSTRASRPRPQSVPEEIANSVSHGVGLVAALAAVSILLLPEARQGGPRNLLGSGIFAVTMVLLYFTSSLYHALPRGRLKEIALKLDYSAIYLFIAGTYTPFTLGVLDGSGGRLICGLIWGLALTGVFLKTTNRLHHPILSTGLYLVMGWLVLATGGSLIERIPAPGVLWLVAGGLSYTIGVVFYAIGPRVRFGHLVWHLFVMAGTTCHFLAVLWHSA